MAKLCPICQNPCQNWIPGHLFVDSQEKIDNKIVYSYSEQNNLKHAVWQEKRLLLFVKLSFNFFNNFSTVATELL